MGIGEKERGQREGMREARQGANEKTHFASWVLRGWTLLSIESWFGHLLLLNDFHPVEPTYPRGQ